MELRMDEMDRACGDALDVAYEFATLSASGQLAQMTGGGLGKFEPGEWSDDTQMAGVIARVSSAGADPTAPTLWMRSPKESSAG